MQIWQTTIDAVHLLLNFDPNLWKIVSVSFMVSFSAIFMVIIPALMCAFVLAYTEFSGRWMLLSLIHTLQAVPTVVIGLLLYMILSRAGPLGDWQMLFTQKAMILGQMLICFPILVSMMYGAFQNSDRRSIETSYTLGVNRFRILLTLLWETRFPLFAAVIAGFSRIVTEVGCSMMVGGNILNSTRNIPTAIALESQKGAFAQGVALGMVLLLLALMLNFFLTSAKGQGHLRT